MCPWWWTQSTSYVGNHTWKGTTDYIDWLSSQSGCNPHCGWFIQWNFSYYNNNWPSQASHWFVAPQDCTSVIGSADGSALTAASSAQTSWIGSRVALIRPSPQVVNNGTVRYCSPTAGTRSNTGALQVRGFSAAAWSATVFDPTAATAAAAKSINANVPQAYTLTAGPTTCSTQSLTSSSNYNYNSSSGVVTVNCPSTGTATYDWTSATQGQNAQSNLKAALASRPLSAALDMCNGKVAPYTGGYPGIQPGTCTITLTGGNVSQLPDATKIQINPQ
jgi:hypothetical protein